MDKFRNSLKFFFYILRLLGLNSIDLTGPPTKVSKLWATYSILVLVGYSYFHIDTVQFDLKNKTGAGGANFVATLIDYCNKYSGLVLFQTSIFVTLARQKRLCELIDLIEEHDSMLVKLPVERDINYARQAR